MDLALEWNGIGFKMELAYEWNMAYEWNWLIGWLHRSIVSYGF
jgi:hypothetical protein